MRLLTRLSMKSFRPFLAGLAGAVTLCFVGCITTSASDPAKTTKADVTVRDADSGKTIQLRQNQLLEVRLAGNLTTGYAWYAVGGRDNDGKAWGNEEVGVLAPYAEHVYIEDRVPAMHVGGGGTDVYRYLARKPGTETLRFICLQPWEHGEIGKRESFKIVVVP